MRHLDLGRRVAIAQVALADDMSADHAETRRRANGAGGAGDGAPIRMNVCGAGRRKDVFQTCCEAD